MGSQMPSTYVYKKDNNLYLLTCGKAIILSSESVALVYSQDENKVVFRHFVGPPDQAAQWVERATMQYKSMGLDSIADSIKTVTNDKWEVEELNRILHEPGYLATFINSKL